MQALRDLNQKLAVCLEPTYKKESSLSGLFFVPRCSDLWGVQPGKDEEKAALQGINNLKDFFHNLGLPVTLEELGVGTDRLGEMAKKSTDGNTRKVGQFVELKTADVLNILKLAKQ